MAAPTGNDSSPGWAVSPGGTIAAALADPDAANYAWADFPAVPLKLVVPSAGPGAATVTLDLAVSEGSATVVVSYRDASGVSVGAAAPFTITSTLTRYVLPVTLTQASTRLWVEASDSAVMLDNAPVTLDDNIVALS